MFCSACGAQNTGQVRFCRTCGKPLSITENIGQSGAPAANEDPFQTRLAIPVEQQSLKQQVQQSSQPAAPPPDPFATMVAMPAANVSKSAPAASAEQPDPFATQVSPSFDAAQLAKELAKKNAAAPPPPSDDMMKTVVGGFSAPVIPPAQPQGQDQGVDMMKTVVGGMPGLPRPQQPPAPGPDPMATVVGMPAINLPPPTKQNQAKPPESKPVEEKKNDNKSAKAAESPKSASVSNATADAPFAQKSVPQNYNPMSTISDGGNAKSSSSTMLYVVIGLVVVVIVIVAAIFFLK